MMQMKSAESPVKGEDSAHNSSIYSDRDSPRPRNTASVVSPNSTLGSLEEEFHGLRLNTHIATLQVELEDARKKQATMEYEIRRQELDTQAKQKRLELELDKLKTRQPAGSTDHILVLAAEIDNLKRQNKSLRDQQVELNHQVETARIQALYVEMGNTTDVRRQDELLRELQQAKQQQIERVGQLAKQLQQHNLAVALGLEIPAPGMPPTLPPPPPGFRPLAPPVAALHSPISAPLISPSCASLDSLNTSVSVNVPSLVSLHKKEEKKGLLDQATRERLKEIAERGIAGGFANLFGANMLPFPSAATMRHGQMNGDSPSTAVGGEGTVLSEDGQTTVVSHSAIDKQSTCTTPAPTAGDASPTSRDTKEDAELREKENESGVSLSQPGSLYWTASSPRQGALVKSILSASASTAEGSDQSTPQTREMERAQWREIRDWEKQQLKRTANVYDFFKTKSHLDQIYFLECLAIEDNDQRQRAKVREVERRIQRLKQKETVQQKLETVEEHLSQNKSQNPAGLEPRVLNTPQKSSKPITLPVSPSSPYHPLVSPRLKWDDIKQVSNQTASSSTLGESLLRPRSAQTTTKSTEKSSNNSQTTSTRTEDKPPPTIPPAVMAVEMKWQSAAHKLKGDDLTNDVLRMCRTTSPLLRERILGSPRRMTRCSPTTSPVRSPPRSIIQPPIVPTIPMLPPPPGTLPPAPTRLSPARQVSPPPLYLPPPLTAIALPGSPVIGGPLPPSPMTPVPRNTALASPTHRNLPPSPQRVVAHSPSPVPPAFETISQNTTQRKVVWSEDGEGRIVGVEPVDQTQNQPPRSPTAGQPAVTSSSNPQQQTRNSSPRGGSPPPPGFVPTGAIVQLPSHIIQTSPVSSQESSISMLEGNSPTSMHQRLPSPPCVSIEQHQQPSMLPPSPISVGMCALINPPSLTGSVPASLSPARRHLPASPPLLSGPTSSTPSAHLVGPSPRLPSFSAFPEELRASTPRIPGAPNRGAAGYMGTMNKWSTAESRLTK